MGNQAQGRSIRREFQREGTERIFSQDRAPELQGREMVPGDPVQVKALAFKIETDSGAETWRVDRTPFDEGGHTSTGLWTFTTDEGVDLTVSFAVWDEYFDASITTKGAPDE